MDKITIINELKEKLSQLPSTKHNGLDIAIQYAKDNNIQPVIIISEDNQFLLIN